MAVATERAVLFVPSGQVAGTSVPDSRDATLTRWMFSADPSAS